MGVKAEFIDDGYDALLRMILTVAKPPVIWPIKPSRVSDIPVARTPAQITVITAEPIVTGTDNPNA